MDDFDSREMEPFVLLHLCIHTHILHHHHHHYQGHHNHDLGGVTPDKELTREEERDQQTGVGKSFIFL